MKPETNMAHDTSVPVCWLKAINSRNGKTGSVERHYQVLSDGYIQVLDITRGKFYKQSSFGSKPQSLTVSDKATWKRKCNSFIKKINKSNITKFKLTDNGK